MPDELVNAGEKLDCHYVLTQVSQRVALRGPHKHYTEDDARGALEYVNVRRILEFVGKRLKEIVKHEDVTKDLKTSC